jgi:hypothetical protein
MPEPSDTDWAYAAGFVDGEGCIAIVRSFSPARDLYQYSVHVVVANSDRRVLDWMHGFWGGWVVAVSTRTGLARPSWTWRTPTGASAKPFLTGIRPWLRLKGPQCENAVAMIELLAPGRRLGRGRRLPPEIRTKQEERYWTQRELNHRGIAAFEAVPMHSPRRIHRERLAAQTAHLASALDLMDG